MNKEAKILSGMAALAIIGVIGVALFSGGGKTPSNQIAEKKLADQALLVKEDSYRIASSSAKVAIVEFGDFQCPACAEAEKTLKKILEEYQGKVSLVYRHFPLPQHKNATLASEAAEAAGAQGKFWEMHDRLYEGQKKWEESKGAKDIFLTIASELGLNMDQFEKDLNSHRFAEKINTDKLDGNQLDLNSTPTFFVNGIKLEGLPSYNDFKKQINANF